jgi:hypothetical protein
MCARAVEYLQLVFNNAAIFFDPPARSFAQFRKQSLGLAGQILFIGLCGTFWYAFILAVVVIKQKLGLVVYLLLWWLVYPLQASIVSYLG